MSAKVIMIVHSSSNFSNGKKTFNYNHKPQYIAIKIYQIMPCALPLPAFLPLPYRFAKNLYSGTSSSIRSNTSANVNTAVFSC